MRFLVENDARKVLLIAPRTPQRLEPPTDCAGFCSLGSRPRDRCPLERIWGRAQKDPVLQPWFRLPTARSRRRVPRPGWQSLQIEI